ncbi:MAG TPA: hypothetical protein VHJ38_04105 [Nitrososphaeraceae archaeon]|jgi:hypothetical protein|nr:hypothetical protein [Nitrososphaeraceae archaeon]
MSNWNTPKNINWKKDVMPIIKERLIILNKYGIIPTLRTIFYSLVFLNVIPNSHNYYKYLTNYTRQARLNGELPIDCFADQNLPRITNSLNEFGNAKEYLQKIVNYLEAVSSTHSLQEEDKCNNKNNNPYNDIEVWIEKNTQSFTFHNLLKNYAINIISNKGIDTTSFVNKNINRLKQSLKDNKKVHIRYFGNFDLFSDNIDTTIKNNIQAFDLNIDFKKIAITEDQMRKYHLPENPNPEIIRKLDNNLRKDFFISKYGRLFQIELESLQAYAPERFKNIILESVNDILNKDKKYENIKNINMII